MELMSLYARGFEHNKLFEQLLIYPSSLPLVIVRPAVVYGVGSRDGISNIT